MMGHAKQPKPSSFLEIMGMLRKCLSPTSSQCSQENASLPRIWIRLGMVCMMFGALPMGWSAPLESASLIAAKAWIQEIASPLSQANRLEVHFTTTIETADGGSQPGYDGQLFTADSNVFRLNIPAGTYVSDGKTYWEYHPSTKQVIVKPAQTLAGKALPARMLLDYLSAEPLSCDTLKQGKASLVRIGLRPSESSANLDSLDIRISLKSRQWQSVGTVDVNGMRTTYTLKKCRAIASLPTSHFVFNPPKGVEIVDMR